VAFIPALAQSVGDSARTVPVDPLVRVPVWASGASVIVIDSVEIARSTARTFSELLQARRPGLRVFRQGGMASDGALVILQGPTSVSAPSVPLVVVDGARVDSRQSPSRLDDILPEDIARIEVLSGPAAALYGDGSASGVILVTTKSGGDGPMRLSGRVTWDAAQARDKFPANYQRIGVSPTTGQPVSDCSLVAVENGQCTPTGLDVWNTLVQASPFHIGNSARGHAEAGGSTLGIRVFLGLTGDYREGELPHDAGSRVDARGKISRVFPWGFDLEANGLYLADEARFGSDIIGSGLIGTAQNDANRGYSSSTTESDSMIPSHNLRHATGGTRLRWQPASWLDASVMTGRDRVTNHGRFDWFGPPPSTKVGNFLTYDEHALTTSGAQISVRYGLPHEIAATTGIGYERDILATKTADTSVFNGPFPVDETDFREQSTALRISQRAVLPGPVALAAGMLRVTSGMFGGGAGKEWFPSANVSWMAPLHSRGVSALRLRAAYAEAANSTPALVSLPVILVSPFDPAPPRPKLERTKETEIGADATIGDSATLSLTAFSSRSINLWVANAVFSGITQSAAMTNRGVEAFVFAPLVDSRNLRWAGSLSMALLRNEVTKLDHPPSYATQGSIVQGKPYGGLWARPYTYVDANHDGILGTNEVQLGTLTYMGAPLPRFESSLATDVTLFRSVVLGATLDYRGSYRMFDETGWVRCTEQVCRGAQDPSASLDEQAAAVASRLAGTVAVGGWTPNVSFMRVREIAIHWPLPASLSGAVGAHLEVTVAGRNLATWTNYRGLDPEISSGLPSALPREELFGMPLPRELVVRLDVNQR